MSFCYTYVKVKEKALQPNISNNYCRPFLNQYDSVSFLEDHIRLVIKFELLAFRNTL